MKKLNLLIMFLLLVSSVTAFTDFYTYENLTGVNVFAFDGDVYILGDLTSYGITSFGYYNLDDQTYTNKSAYGAGSIGSVGLDSGHLRYFKSSSKEILCYDQGTVVECFRFSLATNKWVVVHSYSASGTSDFYGMMFLDSSTQLLNVINAKTNAYYTYFYNSTNNSVAGYPATMPEGRVLRMTNPSSDSEIHLINMTRHWTLHKNDSGKPPYATVINITGLPAEIVDGWTDESTYYVLTSTELWKSTNGIAFTEVVSALCQDYLTLSGVTLKAIDCQSSDNCVIGGEYGSNYPLYFMFNGDECSSDANFYDMHELYNESIERIIYDISYSPEENKYFFIGKNVFGYTTPINLTASGIAACLDNTTLCTNVYNIGGIDYCNTDDIIECLAGCENNACSVVNCDDTCTTENEISCYPNNTRYRQSCERQSNGCLAQEISFDCGTGYECSDGSCVQIEFWYEQNITAECFDLVPHDAPYNIIETQLIQDCIRQLAENTTTGIVPIDETINDGSILDGTDLGTRILLFVIATIILIASIWHFGGQANISPNLLSVVTVMVTIFVIFIGTYFQILPVWISFIVIVIVAGILWKILNKGWE